MADERVVRQSNWGIDTLYSFVCAQNGFSLLEAYILQGKVHSLYGGLRDLKTMLCECFAAVQSLKDEYIDTTPSINRIDPPATVPEYVTSKIGYNVEKSFSFSCTSSAAIPTEHTIGFPPYVDPCSPGWIRPNTSPST